jgi:hypothetical protein
MRFLTSFRFWGKSIENQLKVKNSIKFLRKKNILVKNVEFCV